MNSKVASINKNVESSQHGLNYISDIVADIKAGQCMDVLMDDEDRENEGDLARVQEAP